MTSGALTRALLSAPWLIGLLWLVLHGADWALTLKGARLRHELLAATGATATSDYELNPLFRADVAKLRFFSPRFLVTWAGIGVLMPVLFRLITAVGAGSFETFTRWVAGALLGMLVFTRLSILGRHLRNIFLFSRMLRPADGRPRPVTQLDARTNLLGSAIAFADAAVLLGVAAAITGDPWSTGGVVGLLLLAGKHLVLGLAAPVRQAAPAPARAAPARPHP